MSRLDARFTILDLFQFQDYKKRFIDNIDKIISQYTCEEFVDTLKLSSTFKLIDLRSYLSSLFFDLFNTRDDLSLKFRRGDNINSSLSYDIFILAHCIVDRKISEKVNNIFNLSVKPFTFLSKNEAVNKKIYAD